MNEKDTKAFGGQWDLGETIVENLISYPISKMIDEAAEKSGIDLSNPYRKVMRLVGSGFMGMIVGAALGPFGGLIAGLLGETLATAGNYPGDDEYKEKRREFEMAQQNYTALLIAIRITFDHVSTLTRNKIIEEIQRLSKTINTTQIRPGSKEDFSVTEKVVVDSIRNIDFNVYRNFCSVYEEAKKQIQQRTQLTNS